MTFVLPYGTEGDCYLDISKRKEYLEGRVSDIMEQVDYFIGCNHLENDHSAKWLRTNIRVMVHEIKNVTLEMMQTLIDQNKECMNETVADNKVVRVHIKDQPIRSCPFCGQHAEVYKRKDGRFIYTYIVRCAGDVPCLMISDRSQMLCVDRWERLSVLIDQVKHFTTSRKL